MQVDILTIFPSLVRGNLTEGIIRRALERDLLSVNAVDLRNFALDRHRVTDDYPYGGGQGMVMRPEPIFRAVESSMGRSISSRDDYGSGERVILLTAWGRGFDQALAADLAQERHLVFISGRYEGVDERVRQIVTDEISIGDYVLSGGELAAMVIVDAVVRLLPGAVGDHRSVEDDSFATGLLEGPQYTRPRRYRGLTVPPVLTSGHHEEIRKWRLREALLRTRDMRPDLLCARDLADEELRILSDLKGGDC